MNDLALTVYRLTSRDEIPTMEDLPQISADEQSALNSVLPLIRRPTELLARLLDEGDPPDVWLAPSPATNPGV